MSEDKQSFLGKLKKPFRSHSRSSSSTKSSEAGAEPVDAAYAEGKKAAHHEEAGENPENSALEQAYIEGHSHGAHGKGGVNTADAGAAGLTGADGAGHHQGHDVVNQAYKEGHHQGSGTQGTHGAEGAGVVASSHVGRVVTSPPRVKREPVEKDLSGDFTNKKNPLDDSLVGKERDPEYSDPNCLHENSNPDYANDAANNEGTGYFFDPKDTQGGVYRDNKSGPHDEATRARLEKNRNLKTQPSAYTHQQQVEQQGDKVKDSSYAEGVKAAHRDATQQSQNDRSAANTQDSTNKGTTLDPSEEHSRNKSAFNSSGITTAKKELGVAGAGAGAGAAAAAGGANSRNTQDTSDHVSSQPPASSSVNDNSAARQFAKPGAYDSKTSNPNDKTYLSTSVPPSSKDFDYESELKKLDRQIDQTQHEIENLKSSDVSTTGVYNQDLAKPSATNNTTVSKSLDPKTDQEHSNAAGTGAFAGASGVLAAAASYVGLGGKTYDASEHPTVREAYEAGLKAGSSKSDQHTGAAAGTYQAQPASGTQSVSKSAETRDVSGQSEPDSRNNSAGIFGGAASAASALAAGTLGFGSSDEDKELNKPELTSEDAYVKSSGKATGLDQVNPDGSKKPGFFDGATGALSAAAAAAGIGGGAAAASKDPVDESYEAGKSRGADDAKSPGSSEVTDTNNKSIDTPQRPVLDDVEDKGGDKTNRSSTSTGISGYLAGAAGAIGLPYGSDSNKNTTHASTPSSTDPYAKSGGLVGAVDGHEDVAQAKPHATSKDPLKETEGDDHEDGDGVQQVPGLVSTSETGKDTKSKDKDTKDSKGDASEDPSASGNSSSKGVLASAGAAVGGAAAALGGSKKHTGVPAPGESLIATAEREHEDVAKAPAHSSGKSALKEEGGDNDNDDGVQQVPGLVPASAKDDDKVRDKGNENGPKKITEDEVDAYNKKHGFNKSDKRSLVEIAEGADPEIKNLSSHHGKSVNEEGDEGADAKEGDVQEVPLDAYKQNEFIRSGGKQGSLSDPVDSHPDPSHKDSNPTGKKQENQAYATGHSAKDPAEGEKNPADKIDTSFEQQRAPGSSDSKANVQEKSLNENEIQAGEKSNSGYGSGIIGAGAGAVGGALSYFSGSSNKDQPDEEESNPRPRTAPQSKEVKNDAYNEGLKSGAYESGNVQAAKEVSKDASNTSHGAGGVIGSGTATSAGNNQLSAEDQKEIYAAGVSKAAYEHGHAHGHQENERPKHAEHTKSVSTGNSAVAAGAAGGAGLGGGGAYAANSSSKHQPLDKNPKDELLVEVIGISDKDEASRIARSASKDLSKQGVDLSSGKLVINANTKEIYKTDTDQSAQNLVQGEKNAAGSRSQDARNAGAAGAAGTVGAAGAAGVISGDQSGNNQTGFGSGSRNLKEEDITIPERQDLTSSDPAQPNKFHDEHERAKERLSKAANEGHLGNIGSGEQGHDIGQKDDVLVNVRGTKSNADATKIATGAIQSLKRNHPETLAHADQLNVDSKTGIITDEGGNFVASTRDNGENNSGLSNEGRSGLSHDTYDSSALQNKSGRTTDIGAGYAGQSAGTNISSGLGSETRGGLSSSTYDSSALHNKSGQTTDISAAGAGVGAGSSNIRAGLSNDTYDSSALHNKSGRSTDLSGGKGDAYREPSIGSYPGQNYGLSRGKSTEDSIPRTGVAHENTDSASQAYDSRAFPNRSENIKTDVHSTGSQTTSQTGQVHMPGSFIP